jgi:hypothetical protein
MVNGERNLSVAVDPRTPGLAFKFGCVDADTFGGLKKADAGSITAGEDRADTQCLVDVKTLIGLPNNAIFGMIKGIALQAMKQLFGLDAVGHVRLTSVMPALGRYCGGISNRRSLI